MDDTYQRIVESTGAGILIFDRKTLNILDMNPAACHILSRRPQELLGTSLASFFPESVDWEKNLRSAIDSPQTILFAEITDPSGMRSQVCHTISPLIPDSVYLCTLFPGKPDGHGASLLGSLLGLSPDLLFVLNEKFRFLHFFWGRGSEHGIDPTTLVGKTVHQFLSPASAEKESARYREVLSTRKSLQYRSRIRINGSVLL
ncbi:MAG: PAS domain-containing protein, partial [Methanomicrobiales archaeon]|nr:PAS domain-containing protein [Methanomicrobiales archaeon]